MSTLSVPLTPKLEKAINEMVENGVAENKAALVRAAVEKFAEDQVIKDIREAMQEFREGKFLEGDIDELVKKINGDI